jgi:hypothetical protein
VTGPKVDEDVCDVEVTGPKVVVAVVVIVVVAAVDDEEVRIVSSSSAEIRLNAEERREFVSVSSVIVSESSFLVVERSVLRAESSVKFTITIVHFHHEEVESRECCSSTRLQ